MDKGLSVYRVDKYNNFNAYNNELILHFDDVSPNNCMYLHNFLKATADAGGPLKVKVNYGFV